MAVDPQKIGLFERDFEQALTILKKGSHLLKYGRRGKPRFSAFRLSSIFEVVFQDESALIWYSQSSKKEKHIKLCNVSRIIPGQRTAVFQRYPRPEKDYQSFSLILLDRSLDLICKDKEEADIWFVALKTLISRNHKQRNEPGSPQHRMPRHCPSIPPMFYKNDLADAHPIQVPLENMPENRLGKAFADVILYTAAAKNCSQAQAVSSSLNSSSSVPCIDNSPGRSSTSEAIRVSLSSCKSSSSQGSSHEDYDATGDIFIWGEGIGEGMLGSGMHKFASSPSPKVDALLPKALTSTVILDVHNIACGSRHALLVNKQGEIFSWGEEVGGRLGHGVEANVSQPKLIDTLGGLNFELVACGEHHSCAVTFSGELYTWGDGIHSLGLLGHGSEASHWIPKRVCGELDGIQVIVVACGPWHTAAVTSLGQLFTFGDGAFGALGHGDHSSTRVPREVQALRGLRTARVACGVWHTAAVIEVTDGESPCSGPTDCPSWGQLFTWGDGDKARLGHSDLEPRLSPERVAKLHDQNICQVACGINITVALTAFGRVYTMGSSAYGQLGYPVFSGDVKGEGPTRVLGRLADSFVEEIACGSYHVAVRTAKPQVYTWGRGGKGQLGHGDNNDKNTPTLVDFLKDKQVKSVKCGSNFTTVICLHKGLSGSDNSVCSACRNPFGFRRKCHNCYNCGLVFCNPCSSKKSLKASLAPNLNKPYRVCDDCFTKLKNTTETSSAVQVLRGKVGNKETQFPMVYGPPSRFASFGSSNQVGSWSCKRDVKIESCDNQVTPNLIGKFQLGASLKASIFSATPSKKLSPASVTSSKMVSRATSPISRSTRLITCDTLDASKQRKDVLSKETIILRAQVEDLTRKSQQLEAQLERTSKQLKEEAEKCNSAKEVIRLLTAQLKEVIGRVPEGCPDHSAKGSSITDLVINGSPTMDQISTENESSCDSEAQILSTEEAELKLQTERTEWTVHIDPGTYVTLISLPGGGNELKRIRFSRKHFTQEQAQKWWAEHGTEVCEQYDIRI